MENTLSCNVFVTSNKEIQARRFIFVVVVYSKEGSLQTDLKEKENDYNIQRKCPCGMPPRSGKTSNSSEGRGIKCKLKSNKSYTLK